MGYADVNVASCGMGHDYLARIVEDMLTIKEIPFLTQEQISQDKDLLRFFRNKPPYLITKGRHIFDLYSPNYVAATETSYELQGIRDVWTYDKLTLTSHGLILQKHNLISDAESNQLYASFKCFSMWALSLTSEVTPLHKLRSCSFDLFSQEPDEDSKKIHMSNQADWIKKLRTWVNHCNDNDF